MIPQNPITRTKSSQEPSVYLRQSSPGQAAIPQEQSPVCQRQTCPMQGKRPYCEATRRVTIETTQEADFPVTLNGLHFPDNRITVDLCVICYGILKQDRTLRMLHIVCIGVYAEGQR